MIPIDLFIKFVENSFSPVATKVISMISTLETHIDMYEKSNEEDDRESLCMAATVLNNCINEAININGKGYYSVNNTYLKKLSDLLSKAKLIVNDTLDYTLGDIEKSIDIHAREEMANCSKCNKVKEEDVDYSKYTKAELIELLKNKQ